MYVSGHGSFQLDETIDETNLTGYLDTSDKGKMGSVIHSAMKSYVPQTVSRLTEAIAAKLSYTE